MDLRRLFYQDPCYQKRGNKASTARQRLRSVQKHMPKTIAWLKSLGYKEFHRVRVMCLLPKGFINLHKDQNHSELGAVNVAINNPSKCKFYLQNHGVLDFKPGYAYKLDLVNYHTVVNNSNIPRYHIIIHGNK